MRVACHSARLTTRSAAIQGSGAAVPRSSGAVRSCAELRSRNRLWVGWDDLALSSCISAHIEGATRYVLSRTPAFCVGEVSRLCDGSLQCLVRVPPRRKGSPTPIMGWRWAPTRPSPPWDCDISTTPRHASHARRGRASLATRQARRAGGRGEADGGTGGPRRQGSHAGRGRVRDAPRPARVDGGRGEADGGTGGSRRQASHAGRGRAATRRGAPGETAGVARRAAAMASVGARQASRPPGLQRGSEARHGCQARHGGPRGRPERAAGRNGAPAIVAGQPVSGGRRPSGRQTSTAGGRGRRGEARRGTPGGGRGESKRVPRGGSRPRHGWRA